MINRKRSPRALLALYSHGLSNHLRKRVAVSSGPEPPHFLGHQ